MSSWRQYPLNEALASSNSRPLVPCCPLPLFSSSSPLFPLSLPITCLPGWLDWGISLRQENGVSSWHLPDLWEERVRVGWGEGQRGAEGTSGFLGVVGEGMEWGGDRWWEGWESRRDRQRAHELVLGVVSKRGKWFRGCITDIKEGNVFPLGRRERRERQQIDVNFKPKRELPNSLLFLLVEQEKGELQVSRCNSKCREFLNYLGKKILTCLWFCTLTSPPCACDSPINQAVTIHDIFSRITFVKRNLRECVESLCWRCICWWEKVVLEKRILVNFS